jgi:flavin reductase (DIM6/NTAB) family NADH-FMN oxidoreductase RutF
MPSEFVSVSMNDLGALDAYGLLGSLIIPRPIAFISTLDKRGVLNLAPYSFFTMGGSNPASLVFSATLGADSQPKDTLRNVIATGEFVVNCVHRELAEGLAKASGGFPKEISEWEVCGFTPIDSRLVKPPRIAESKAQLECRLFKVVDHGDGIDAARYVIGEVVFVHLDAQIAGDLSLFKPVSRLGGSDYHDLSADERFRLNRAGGA